MKVRDFSSKRIASLANVCVTLPNNPVKYYHNCAETVPNGAPPFRLHHNIHQPNKYAGKTTNARCPLICEMLMIPIIYHSDISPFHWIAKTLRVVNATDCIGARKANIFYLELTTMLNIGVCVALQQILSFQTWHRLFSVRFALRK